VDRRNEERTLTTRLQALAPFKLLLDVLSPEHVVLFPHLDHASDDLGVDKRLDRLDVLGLARDGKSLVCKSFGDGRADLIGKKRATALLGDGLVESAEGRASVWEKGKSETRGE
jgi:hypothetical protein